MSRWRLLALYGAALALLVLAGSILTRYFRKLESDIQWVEHSHEVTLSFERGIAQLIDAESRMRGFVIRGDDWFIQPYDEAIRLTRAELGRSSALTSDSATQHARVVHLQEVAEQRIVRMDGTIAKRRNGPLTEAPSYIGRTLMADMRGTVADAIKEEDALLAQRMTLRRRAFRQTYLAVMVALALSFLLLAIATRAWAWNISRRRELELEAKQARERENASAFRELFIGVVGHDLRSPISSIAVGAELLERRKLPEESARVVTRIRISAERMERMVGQILDFARIRLGAGIPIDPASTPLADVVRKIIDELRDVHPDASIVFEGEPSIVGDWDSDRLAQVISNLIGNAIVHGDGTEPVSVKIQAEADAAKLTVHNSSAPIPPEIQKTLFEPFRSGPRKSAKSQGLGLGLYVCDQIVSAHGGTIRVRSSVGEGTTFEVRLPIRRVGENPPR